MSTRECIMQSVAQDLRCGTRVLLKDPGFTAVAVLTLAIGVAATTTVFSWIENVLVRPLPGARNESDSSSSSGFSAHVGEPIEPGPTQHLEDVAAYLVRNPLSAAREGMPQLPRQRPDRDPRRRAPVSREVLRERPLPASRGHVTFPS